MATTDDREKREREKARDERDLDDRSRLRVPVVYEIIRQEGEEELSRPLTSLWWSGVAAGLGISMSVVAQGLLTDSLPDTPWRSVVASLGYCVGFLVAVIGRLQLFTENTITVVLPLLADRTLRNLRVTAELWLVVLGANLLGVLVFALAVSYGGIFSPEHAEAFLAVSHHLVALSPTEVLLRGIPAGFLIATMVWMLPSAKGQELWVIVLITYLIALGDLTHVVAGSAEAFLLLLHGDIGLVQSVFGFILPAFVGNVVGGTVLFALLAYGQVKEEL